MFSHGLVSHSGWQMGIVARGVMIGTILWGGELGSEKFSETSSNNSFILPYKIYPHKTTWGRKQLIINEEDLC